MTARRLMQGAFGLGGAGLLASAAGWVLAPAAFPHAWLAALTAWMGWPLGSMGLLLVHGMTGGRWGTAIRPQLVAGSATLPLLVLLLLPLPWIFPALYPWAAPKVTAQLSNRFYLNAPFFAIRVLTYTAIWLALGVVIRRRLRRNGPLAPLGPIAAAGLIGLVLATNFAAIDFTMSLDPHFASSVYGLIAIAQDGLLALSVAIFARAVLGFADMDSLAALSRLLMALLVLWAYLDFMQVLIVWQSDLPSEAPWYLARSSGGWGIVAGVIVVLHFLLPFFALLSPRLRHSARGIAIVAGLLITSGILRAWWLVLPAAGRGITWIDAATMLAVLGLAAGMALHPAASRSGCDV